MIKLGSHVSFAAPGYYAGSIQEALSYKANALMLYTGPPQNNKRVPMEKCKVEEGLNLLKEKKVLKMKIVLNQAVSHCFLVLCQRNSSEEYQ